MTDVVTRSSSLFVLYRLIKIFYTHEDFIGVYNVNNIKADTLVTVIKGVSIRLNIPISNARGQCYDGPENMRCIENCF